MAVVMLLEVVPGLLLGDRTTALRGELLLQNGVKIKFSHTFIFSPEHCQRFLRRAKTWAGEPFFQVSLFSGEPFFQVSLVVSAGGGSSLHLPSSINQINMRLRDNNKDSFLGQIDQVVQSIEEELEAEKKVQQFFLATHEKMNF